MDSFFKRLGLNLALGALLGLSSYSGIAADMKRCNYGSAQTNLYKNHQEACQAGCVLDPNAASSVGTCISGFPIGNPPTTTPQVEGVFPNRKETLGCFEIYSNGGMVPINTTCTCFGGSTMDLAGNCRCPAGQGWNGTICTTCPGGEPPENGICKPVAAKTYGCPELPPPGVVQLGNPCNPGTGVKTETQVVYRSPAQDGLSVRLSYNSEVPYDEFNNRLIRFGRNWVDSLAPSLVISSKNEDGTVAEVVLVRPSGQRLTFKREADGSYKSDADVSHVLEPIDEGFARWKVTSPPDDEVEKYDAEGLILSVAARSDLILREYTYSTNTAAFYPSNAPTCDEAHPLIAGNGPPAGRVLCVTDPFKKQINLQYDSLGRVVKVFDPGGGEYLFEYDGISGGCTTPGGSAPACTAQNLTRITFPDTKTRTFFYNQATHINGGAACSNVFLNHLTGIDDEMQIRYADFTYDCNGRATSTQHAGGAGKVTLAYDTPGVGQTTVEDFVDSATSPATARVYSFSKIHSIPRLTGILDQVGAAKPCANCGSYKSLTYDANGNVASRTDWNGNVTSFPEYESARNLERRRIEAAGAGPGLEREIHTQWHGTFRLPTVIAEPRRTTTNVYDPDGSLCGARGALCSRTIQPTTDNGAAEGDPRTWTSLYDPNNRSVLSVSGPRTQDVTTYSYYGNEASCPTTNFGDAKGCRGQVLTIKNALLHTWTIEAYNAHRQPLRIEDPNGLVTLLDYDARQRLVSRTVGALVTSYEYRASGQLAKVTLPDASFLTYFYDDAQRLEKIEDNLGNRILYTLDTKGNRKVEDVRDPAGALAQTRSRVFNELNQLTQDIGAAGQATVYAYDGQGNLKKKTMPLAPGDTVERRSYDYTYDALNRVDSVEEPPNDNEAGTVRKKILYGYDALDQLKSVTDQRSLVTQYTVNGVGDLKQQISPDTGTTNFSNHDAAGNLGTQIDAKNQSTTYTYDALNRVSQITFQDQSKHVYVYDEGVQQKGRLTSIMEKNPADQVTGQIAYSYDQHGRMTSETRLVAGVQRVTGYAYDSAGRLSVLTYPSGRTVTYGYDDLGRVNRVDTAKQGLSQLLVQNVLYHPFGGVKEFTLGNGQLYKRRYDTDGRIFEYTLGAETVTMTFDNASRIKTLSASIYDYDNLDRVTSAVSPMTDYGYTYDAVGNRRSRTAGSASDTYKYESVPDSNRITRIEPLSGPARDFSHDPNGSTTADGLNTYGYDVRGRMNQAVSSLGTTTYEVNALGQRVRKTSSLGDTVFHYDMQGRLIAEASPSGPIMREYIYLGDIPVAVALPVTTLGGLNIVDNVDAGFSETGFWNLASMNPGYYGTNYLSAQGSSSVTATATWALQVPTTGTYSVFAWWSAESNRATNAKYTVNHAGGATQVTVNQQQNGSQWNLLGTFMLNQGSAHNVTITNQANGRVVADAVLITSGSQLPPPPPLPQVDINAAADTFTRSTSPSTNFGTQDTIKLRQATSQQWGYIRFNLSNVQGEVTSATLAIRLEAGPSSTTTVSAYPVTDTTWGETTINWSNQPAVGAAAVGSGNVHGANTGWYELDVTAYVQAELALGRNVISLALKVAGSTVQEWEFASRESQFGSRPRIRIQAVHPSYYYVHTDHLNTPRLATDASGTTVWRWDQQEPFGVTVPDQNPSGLGTFELPLRFPGQYADKETNLHYNYFRDCYDPATGRYCQSDPIGLAGGINIYLYVGGNPLSNTDPLGLAAGSGTGAIEGVFAGIYAQKGLAIGKGLCANPGINVANIHDHCTDQCLNILPQKPDRRVPSGGSQEFTSCLSGCMAGFKDCRNKPRSACPDPSLML